MTCEPSFEDDRREAVREDIVDLVEQMKKLQARIQDHCDEAQQRGSKYFDEKNEVSWDMVSDFCGQSVTDATESVSSCLVESEEDEEEEVVVEAPVVRTAEDRRARAEGVFALLRARQQK